MVLAALGTVFAAAYLLWLYQRTAFGEPPAEFTGADTRTPSAPAVNDEHHDTRHPRRHADRVDRLDADAVLILVLGVYPQLLFQIFDPAVTAARRPTSGSTSAVIASLARPGRRVGVADDRLARHRARAGPHRRHQRRARHRPADRRDEEVGDGHAHRVRAARRVHPDRHARPSSATTCARCSTAATSSTSSR